MPTRQYLSTPAPRNADCWGTVSVHSTASIHLNTIYPSQQYASTSIFPPTCNSIYPPPAPQHVDSCIFPPQQNLFAHLRQDLLKRRVDALVAPQLEPQVAQAVHHLHVVLPPCQQAAAVRVKHGAAVLLLALVQRCPVRLIKIHRALQARQLMLQVLADLRGVGRVWEGVGKCGRGWQRGQGGRTGCPMLKQPNTPEERRRRDEEGSWHLLAYQPALSGTCSH